ncbi:uncharacterized protein PV06_03173 [Exophiala oligosperma]|uniref:Uncharacterized protein n=1 Tax=Exophiala oligosperma TaxID=215243 RepID=A0A0D2AY07_9EURO|nr:uncharacterized protein PV06_03173 [Exophiala oligosperma]KIW44721.1 hypothetical protein PV06_03173 [Exophiala oligosperma]
MQALPQLCRRAYIRPNLGCRSLSGRNGFDTLRPFSSSASLRAARKPPNMKPVRNRQNNLTRLNKGPSPLDNYYITLALGQKLTKLGFRSIPTVVKLFNHHRAELQRAKILHDRAVPVSLHNSQWTRTYEEALTSDEVALVLNPSILPHIFEAFGEADFHRQNVGKFAQLGYYSLCCAFEAGDLEAAIKVAFIEHQSKKVSSKVSGFIKQHAAKRSDWRTMSLWCELATEMSHSKEGAEANYLLAKELDTILEPSNRPMSRAEMFERYRPTWSLVHDSANHYLSHFDRDDPEGDPVQKDLDNAIRDGVKKWKDPKAAHELLLLPGEVKKFSDRWLSLLTMSAMEGSAEHCVRLALYHLGKDGWLNHHLDENDDWVVSDRKDKPKNWIGIEWLGLSAALENADASLKTRRYLRLALLLREHGLEKDAMPWLTAAKHDLEDQGLDTDREWIEYIDGFEQHWYNEEFMTRTSEEDWFLEDFEVESKNNAGEMLQKG